MPYLTIRFILPLLLLFCPYANAYGDETTPAFAHIWLKLCHYHKSLTTDSGYVSYVSDSAFFLSSNGKVDPQSEFNATLALFNQKNSDDKEKACRYPARYQWLTSQGYNFPPLNCPDYEQWINDTNPYSMSLIFPAAYMNGPSSMFGHTLLRIDQKTSNNHSLWLSLAVSFGADINTNDASPLYAWKGIVGGYSGTFEFLSYYKKLQEYNRMENRDIWEYKLDITPDQTKFISSHLWELQDIMFDYYFFDENCSFRILELLELSRSDLDLTTQFRFSAIPVDTVRAVLDANLILDTYYRPSNVTQFINNISSLSFKEKKIIHKLIKDPKFLTNTDQVDKDLSIPPIFNKIKSIDQNLADRFHNIPEEKQVSIIQSAYKYIDYQGYMKNPSTKLKNKRFELLKELNKLRPIYLESPSSPMAPEKSHKSSMASLYTGYNNNMGSFIDLQGRIAYHDLLDNQLGITSGAEITMGDLQLRKYNGESIKIEKLDVIGIRSQYMSDMFFKPSAWQFRFGTEQQPGDTEDEHSVLHFSGGYGLAKSATDKIKWFGLMTSRLEYNRGFQHRLKLAPGINTGIYGRNIAGNWRLEWQLDQFLNSKLRSNINLAQQWEIQQNHGFRILANYKEQNHRGNYTGSLGWIMYF